MKFAAYAGTSMVLATGVVVKAIHERANFYSACVYVAQSNACLMILTNLVLLGVGMVMLGLQRLLYGRLRPIEVEQLYEKAWFAITETCLAMTIFREEVGAWFGVMFVSLLIGKIWGWIGEGRVEILEQQPPSNPRLFHARLSTSLVLSVLFDAFLLNYSVQTVRRQARANMMVMFAFEFAVLTVSSLSTSARYGLYLQEAAVIRAQTAARIQQRREQWQRERIEQGAASEHEPPPPTEEELEEIDVPGWEEKGRWTFYLDLLTGLWPPALYAYANRSPDFFKLILYLTFFCVLCMYFGMPIHIIRDVALTVRSFYKRITDFLKYRQATKDMNARYPDATAQDMGNEDVCIICREGMHPWQGTSGENAAEQNVTMQMDERLRPKKLPCGHVLHFACLRSWLERQQICPTCRRPVLSAPTTADISPPRPGEDPANRQANPARPEPAPAAGGVAQPPPEIGRPPEPLQNRIRYFNLGPLRLGFGAGDLNMLEQQLNHQHQARRNPPGHSTSNQVESQLRAMEQQMMREINDLHFQNEELSLIRAMQGELARLRILRGSESSRLPFGQPPGFGSTTVQPSIQAFAPAPRPTATAPELPAGFSIPDGWTVLPLQRLPANRQLPVLSANMSSPSGLNHLPRPLDVPPAFQTAIVPPTPPSNDQAHTTNGTSTGAANSTANLPNAAQRLPETSNTESLTNNFDHRATSSKPADAAASVSSDADDVPFASSAERRAAKGKSRATTVEDDVEEADIRD